MPFSILYVCTGNRCRSPFAELLTHRLLAEAPRGGQVSVGSAGTRALVGSPMDEAAARQARARGLCTDEFRSRQVTPELVAAADLVLTATRDQRREVLAQQPTALRRTFTMLEFGDLLERLGRHAAPRDAVSAAAERRSGGRPPDYDVIDPVGAGVGVHASVAGHLDTAVRAVVDGLFGVAAGPRA